MAASASSGNTTPFFGCKISLISKSEIRYEGILYTIDPKESTIALAKVRSFGSEDRHVERPVPPRDDIFEFIIFRASDIKDLIVDDPPPPPALADPAIIQAQHSTTNSTSFPSSFPQGSINAPGGGGVAAPAPVAPQQTPLQQLQQQSKAPTAPKHETQTDSKPKASTSLNAPVNYSKAAGGGGGSLQQQQPPKQQQPNQRQNLQFNRQQPKSNEQANQQTNRVPNQQQSQNVQNQNGFPRRNNQQQGGQQNQQNRVIGENQNPNYHSRNGQNQREGERNFNNRSFQNQRFSSRGGMQGQFGGFRRGGMSGNTGGPRNFISHRPLTHHNGPKFPPLPDGDFDFEKAQADFKILEEKLNALKLNGGALGSDGEGNSGADSTDVVVPGIPASAINVATLEQQDQEILNREKEGCYNKTKSFFDSISCEALEREKGGHRVDWKLERKLNRETFGQVSARRPTFFRVNNRGGGFGGGYNQHRSGGYHQQNRNYGGYQNRNYQNRQPRAPGSGGGQNNVSSTTGTNTRTPNAKSNAVNGGVGASPAPSSAAPIAIASKN